MTLGPIFGAKSKVDSSGLYVSLTARCHAVATLKIPLSLRLSVCLSQLFNPATFHSLLSFFCLSFFNWGWDYDICTPKKCLFPRACLIDLKPWTNTLPSIVFTVVFLSHSNVYYQTFLNTSPNEMLFFIQINNKWSKLTTLSITFLFSYFVNSHLGEQTIYKTNLQYSKTKLDSMYLKKRRGGELKILKLSFPDFGFLV